MLAATLLVSGALTVADLFELLTPPASKLGRQGWRAIVTPVFPFRTAELPSVGPADTLVFGIFFLGAFACFGASALFHTSLCHTKEVSVYSHPEHSSPLWLADPRAPLPSLPTPTLRHPAHRSSPGPAASTSSASS